jgi:hypothetical protein
MEKVNDKTAKPTPTNDDDSDQWDSYDYYDCKPPKVPFTQEYVDQSTPPAVKEAIARRQTELKAARSAAAHKPIPKRS